MLLRQHVPKSGADVVAGLKRVFWISGPLLASALYGADEGSKDAATVAASLGPSSDA